ncbi:hypothetical protein ACO22_00640 [Paracoccidioides brasiliensis]|uniref:Uncharacterized protein n=1 Tax=Paracoccidioides brasiliensis TaxID=121759 RepID=A0A1D2JNX6_PARBR|nr:hypothetical protein ACO22_00640 [Paracoccidioides brasiliensis]
MFQNFPGVVCAVFDFERSQANHQYPITPTDATIQVARSSHNNLQFSMRSLRLKFSGFTGPLDNEIPTPQGNWLVPPLPRFHTFRACQRINSTPPTQNHVRRQPQSGMMERFQG